MGRNAIRRTRSGAANSRTLAVLALAAGLLAAQASSAQPGSVLRGRDLVQRNCAMCHAVGRMGASPSPAAPAFRDLHRRYSVDSLADALTLGLITGHPRMPAFKFSTQDVHDIIRYLNSIQTLQPAKADPAGPPAATASAGSASLD